MITTSQEPWTMEVVGVVNGPCSARVLDATGKLIGIFGDARDAEYMIEHLRIAKQMDDARNYLLDHDEIAAVYAKELLKFLC